MGQIHMSVVIQYAEDLDPFEVYSTIMPEPCRVDGYEVLFAYMEDGLVALDLPHSSSHLKNEILAGG
jgi:hypothetical protein